MVGRPKFRIAKPLIILALPRSFSSLTCAMLGQHWQMFDLLETQLFEVDTMEAWWDSYIETHDSDGLIRSIAEVMFGGQTAREVKIARKWIWERLSWSTTDVAWLLAERLYPLGLVEKTPLEHSSKQVLRNKLQRRLRTF